VKWSPLNPNTTTFDSATTLSFTHVCIKALDAVDLEATRVNVSSLVTDLDTLQVTGPLFAEITNKGATADSKAFTVVFFEDLNENHQFDGADLILAQVEQSGFTEATAVATVTLTEANDVHMKYAGDLVYAFVDSTNAITETNETNNIASAKCIVAQN
jgi:hypothetical protein